MHINTILLFIIAYILFVKATSGSSPTYRSRDLDRLGHMLDMERPRVTKPVEKPVPVEEVVEKVEEPLTFTTGNKVLACAMIIAVVFVTLHHL